MAETRTGFDDPNVAAALLIAAIERMAVSNAGIDQHIALAALTEAEGWIARISAIFGISDRDRDALLGAFAAAEDVVSKTRKQTQRG